MIRSIPLNKLVPSPRNVRRSSDPTADLQLKADIEARGLLQNLVVTSIRKPRGAFAVEAGERRRRALVALAEESKLDPNHEVCCLVIERDAAQEAGLAENFQRLSMNAADECLAFGQLIGQGADVEGVARRFGLTVRFVEGRLRLADLAPIVFDALGADEITLDAAKAYAATPDRERQAWVFEQMRDHYGAHHPDSIRRLMTQATASAADRRAHLVGEEAYVAAGGRIERDLFADDAATHWLDVALLDRLAADKLEALANEAAAEAGLAWVRPTLDGWVGYALTAGLERLPAEPEPLTEDEIARVGELEAEIEALVAIIEDDETTDEAREKAESGIQRSNEAIRAMEDKPPQLDPELKGRAGTFLLLDDHGRPRLHSAFYVEPEPNQESDDGAEHDAERSRDNPDHEAAAADDISPTAPALSRRLLDELSMQRRDILAVHIAGDPALALDLAIFLMVDREAGYTGEKSGFSLSATHPMDPAPDFRTPEAAAVIALAQTADALDRGWTEGATKGERFDRFRGLPEKSRAAWLSHAVAGTVQASLGGGGRSCAFHDHLANRLGIDVAKWWRPAGATWFDRVPKALALDALGTVGGHAFATRYSKAKKAELSQTCERIFAGDFIGEVEVKQAALAWLPEQMRFTAAEQATKDNFTIDDLPPWEEVPDNQPGGSFAVAADDESGPGGGASAPEPDAGAKADERRGDEPVGEIDKAA